MARNHIVLVGAMGSGKTAVGTRLAAALRRPFIDSDEQIEAIYGTTGRALAQRRGVEWLHDAEAKAFADALGSAEPAVIAAAASIADRIELVAGLQSNDLFVVLLEAELEVLAERMETGSHRRPVDWDDMTQRMRQRQERFAAVADVVISTTLLDLDSVVSEVLGVHARRL